MEGKNKANVICVEKIGQEERKRSTRAGKWYQDRYES
jgi:hypothetical protein